MSIQPIGFLDTSQLSALFTLKLKDQMVEGILPLRAMGDEDVEPRDLPIVRQSKAVRAILSRVRSGAAPYFQNRTPGLGRAWIESLPPGSGTPWIREEGDYADAYVRTRTCLIPCPLAQSYCGPISAILAVGFVNVVDHRQLCCEVNFGEHTRVHLVVDVQRLESE